MSRTVIAGKVQAGLRWQAGLKMAHTRLFSESPRAWQVKKEGKQEKGEDKLYYYEIPGNKLNPHSYFYRVLAVPYMKFCGVIIATYYGMTGLWQYLESSEGKGSVEAK